MAKGYIGQIFWLISASDPMAKGYIGQIFWLLTLLLDTRTTHIKF